MEERIPLWKQIAEVEEELDMRRYVYPKRVTSHFMTPAQADLKMKAMEAVLNTLKALSPADQGDLWEPEKVWDIRRGAFITPPEGADDDPR